MAVLMAVMAFALLVSCSKADDSEVTTQEESSIADSTSDGESLEAQLAEAESKVKEIQNILEEANAISGGQTSLTPEQEAELQEVQEEYERVLKELEEAEQAKEDSLKAMSEEQSQ